MQEIFDYFFLSQQRCEEELKLGWFGGGGAVDFPGKKCLCVYIYIFLDPVLVRVRLRGFAVKIFL